MLSDIGLDLLGEVADGEENEYTYSFGDGSCGSNTTLLTKAALSFFVLGDPQGTTGMRADLDTTRLSNGEHVLGARTVSGESVKTTVTVNNAPRAPPSCCPRTARWSRAASRCSRTSPRAPRATPPR